MTVLVTGGTGYVAGWVIKELLDRGYQVRTTIRGPDRARQAGERERLAYAVADLTRDEGWAEAVAGVDHVLHVASPLGDETRRQLPDLLVRFAALFDPSLRAITVSLGRRNRHSAAKAERVLGWKPRPAAETVVDCARSLIGWEVVPVSMGAS